MALSTNPPPRGPDDVDASGRLRATDRKYPQHRGAPSRRSLSGLDWLNFFVADVQTGFGPFVAVYLTAQAWTQVDIGLVLTAGGLVSLAGQIPGGAIIDAARSKQRVAAIAIALIAASALMLAIWPIFPVVLAAELLHGGASCLVGPAIAAISLGLVGHAAVGERLGRNARFASIGNGIAAALMGACGLFFSTQAVFFVTAALAIPALWALLRIRAAEIDPLRARGGAIDAQPSRGASLFALAGNRALLVFAGCLVLFHLANAAMLPLAASMVTMRAGDMATALIAACMVVPQLVVAFISPWVGHQAELRGRRLMLLLGFAALPVRGVLFAMVGDPYVLVVVQILDGVSAAVLGVMFPLVVADATRGTGHFNLALGLVGCAMGIGASLSTTVAGYIADEAGSGAAFLAMAGIAGAGFALVWTSMPETRPEDV